MAWLDLDEFTTYEQDALAYLVSNISELEFASFGFRHLTFEGVNTLSRLPVSYFYLTNLVTLDEQVASVIGGWERTSCPIRCIHLREPLSVEVARALIPLTEDIYDAPLELAVPSISLEVAGVLRQHSHELFLKVLDEALSPHVAEELSRHAGYFLLLDVAQGLSPESLAGLMGNPAKQVRLDPGPEPMSIRVLLSESI